MEKLVNFEKNLALVGIMNYLPPRVQKVLIDYILTDSDIKLEGETLEQYEKYFQRVYEKFEKDYMEKH